MRPNDETGGEVWPKEDVETRQYLPIKLGDFVQSTTRAKRSQ